MTRDEAKDYIKDQLKSYLSSKGINIQRQKPFNCLNPEHNDRRPSMSYDKKRNKVHCFSCGADYDMFDVIGAEYGLKDNKDIFNKAYEVFNIDLDDDWKESFSPVKPFIGESRDENQFENEQYTHKSIHITTYIQKCHDRIGETVYAESRGLSKDIIDRFKLGYDPHYETMSKETGKMEKWKTLIIPTGDEGEESFIARNINPSASKEDRHRRPSGSGIKVFNKKALWDSEKPIFIVEGEIDALSVMTVAGEAVALGSTANINKFVEVVKNKEPKQKLIIALDNDNTGKTATEKLIVDLIKFNIPYCVSNPYGDKKDANEALIADIKVFEAAIRRAEKIANDPQLEEREAYLQNNTAAYLQSFIDGIKDSVNTSYISTGFRRLDDVLDGGLYEGLYIMGGISSLGKTTFIMQIADQIAHKGEDVLIFSLEMSRMELMSKSISRHTLISVLENNGNMSYPKTARGITTGKRYSNYDSVEKELINSSVKSYGKYASNIYISEGIGDIGAEQIRETVKKHILFTGKSPVVIVDYLQILAPYSDRATDKQNIDKAVLELKRISRDYKIPVVGISSFNRSNYKVAVAMEAFKESGAIEYSSDVLIGLQLEGAGTDDFDATEKKKEDPRKMEVVILKNRNGAVGDKIPYKYYSRFNFFKEDLFSGFNK